MIAVKQVVFIGEMTVAGDTVLLVVSPSREQAEHALLAEWRDYERKAKPRMDGQVIETFSDLEEFANACVRESRMNEVLWP
jgi:hypothetical protein